MNDPSLFIEKAYVNGAWVDSQSGKTFEVYGRWLAFSLFNSFSTRSNLIGDDPFKQTLHLVSSLEHVPSLMLPTPKRLLRPQGRLSPSSGTLSPVNVLECCAGGIN